MDNFIDIFAEIMAVLLMIGIAWLIGKAKDYLVKAAEATGNDYLVSLIESFCAAVEQQLKADDPTGAKRKARVCELLVETGVEITDAVDAMIEAAVYRINKGA